MKIAINAWILRNKKLDGIGYFTVHTFSALIKAHPETEFLVMCDKKYAENYFDFPNVTLHRIFPALRHPVLYVIYLELVVPLFLRKHKPDVFVSPDGYLSLLSSCKQLPVIHDINFEHNPQDIKFRNRIYFKFFFKRFVRKAKRIATISEYSKEDIAGYYGIDRNKIDNISNGVSSNFAPLQETEKPDARMKWSEGKQYLFFVGSMHPRKNINNLIAAFGLFKQKTGSDMKLVLAGSILWSKSDIEAAYLGSPYKTDIIFTGRLSDEELKKALGAAFALCFVPTFEGFGLPIVEAMQSDVPVISSDTTSMPEVAGDAAVYADPFSIESIAAAMEKVYADDILRKMLVEKGRVQRTRFSWGNTASLLWESIRKVIA